MNYKRLIIISILNIKKLLNLNKNSFIHISLKLLLLSIKYKKQMIITLTINLNYKISILKPLKTIYGKLFLVSKLKLEQYWLNQT